MAVPFLSGWNKRRKMTISNFADGYQTRLEMGVEANAMGGTITTSGNYTIHTFTKNGTFIPIDQMDVEYLIVGGGGGGGGGEANPAGDGGGGGGAGGFRTGTISVTSQAYNIIVGSGGAGATGSGVDGSPGNSSSFAGVESAGGGFGGKDEGEGGSGGSGGGGNKSCAGGTVGGAGNTPATVPSQGNNGGGNTAACTKRGGGGGGGASTVGETITAATVGARGGNGGSGTSSSITGASVEYAGGGGGGGASNTGVGGTGGTGGGGAGGNSPNGNGNSGTTNKGGGGGAAGSGTGTGGAGGSGVVIIRYLTPSTPPFSFKNDFSDIRFTKDDGITKLNYWIESYVDSTSLVVWIKLESLISPADFYIYYDNPSATSESSGTNTFDVFEDFENTDIGSIPAGWSNYNLGDYPKVPDADIGASNDVAYQGSKSFKENPNTHHSALLNDAYNFSNGVAEVLYRTPNKALAGRPGIVYRYVDQNNFYTSIGTTDTNQLYHRKNINSTTGGTNLTPGQPFTYQNNYWHHLKVIANGNSLTVIIDLLSMTATDNSYASGKVGILLGYIGIQYYDLFFVHQFQSTEPSISFESQESLSGVSISLGFLKSPISKGMTLSSGSSLGRNKRRRN